MARSCDVAASDAAVRPARRRREREHDRDGAQGLGAAVNRKRDVREHEVQGRSAAVQHDRMQEFAERPCGDEPRHRFVLVQRFVCDVRKESNEEEGHDPREGERRRQRRGGAQLVAIDRSGAHGG